MQRTRVAGKRLVTSLENTEPITGMYDKYLIIHIHDGMS